LWSEWFIRQCLCFCLVILVDMLRLCQGVSQAARDTDEIVFFSTPFAWDLPLTFPSFTMRFSMLPIRHARLPSKPLTMPLRNSTLFPRRATKTLPSLCSCCGTISLSGQVTRAQMPIRQKPRGTQKSKLFFLYQINTAHRNINLGWSRLVRWLDHDRL
jgi:hypothetical protein